MKVPQPIVEEMLEIIVEFVRRVECEEVKSRKTYAHCKAVLARLELSKTNGFSKATEE